MDVKSESDLNDIPINKSSENISCNLSAEDDDINEENDEMYGKYSGIHFPIGRYIKVFWRQNISEIEMIRKRKLSVIEIDSKVYSMLHKIVTKGQMAEINKKNI